MRYLLKTAYLILFISLSSFQCSRWAKYSENISLEITPNKLISVNDSIDVIIEVSVRKELFEKNDYLGVTFFYLNEQDLTENHHDEIGDINLTPTQNVQRKSFKFKFSEGKKIYAKQVIKKNKKRIESPLIVVAEQ
tara:strand:+ start:3011 stop:3418 length:408 start_codon:yes stop_codon:yes gene_type:complete